MSLRIETVAPVANLVIDRPERHNSFSDQMWSELPGLLEAAAADAQVRVLAVRSSSERVFSAGADVEDLRRAINQPEDADRGLAVIRNAFESLLAFPKPTVAVVRGACHGGGVGLSVCCDLRLADTSAMFSIPPARLGLLYPYPALRRLVWMVGPGRAKHLLFTARTFDAVEAHRIGFLDELHEPAALAAAVDRLTGEIAANAPQAIQAMKRVVGLTEQASDDAERIALDLERAALIGTEHAEGVAAFLDKRTPTF